MSNVGGVGAVGPTALLISQGASPTNLSVLPAAELNSAELGDGLAMMFAMLAKQQHNQISSQQGQIQAAAKQREANIHEAKQALQRAMEAKNNPFGFIGDLFKGIVTAVATVTTLGAGASVALGLSWGGFVAQETKAFGDSSGFIGDFLKTGGALLSGEAWLAAADACKGTGGVMAQSGNADLEVAALGFQIAGGTLESGAVFGCVAMNEQAQKGLQTIEDGTRQITQGIQKHDMLNAQADEKRASNAAHRLERMIEGLIDGIKEVHKSHDHATKTVIGTMEILNNTAAIAAGTRV